MENGISGRQLGGLLIGVSLLLLSYIALTGTLSLRLMFFVIFFIIASMAAFYVGKRHGKREYSRD